MNNKQEMCKHYDPLHTYRCHQGLRGNLKCHSQRADCQFYEPSESHGNKQQTPDGGLLTDEELATAVRPYCDACGRTFNPYLRQALWIAVKAQLAKAKSHYEHEDYDPQAEIFGRFIDMGWIPPTELNTKIEDAVKQIEEEILQILNKEYPVRAVWQRYQALKGEK